MPKYVQTPDGVYQEFPDEATTQQISDVLNKVAAPTASKPEITPDTWRQAVGKGQVIFSNRVVGSAVQNAPTIGGAVGGALGGIPGAVAGGAVGSLVKQATNAATGRTTDPVSPLGAAARVAGEGAGQGALQAIGEKGPELLAKTGRAVYRSYLKPSLAAANIRDAETVVDTAIREALPVSKGGVEKAQKVIDGLKAEVRAELAQTPGEVDLQRVADRVRQWATRTFYKPGVPSADYDAAMTVANSIDNHPSFARLDWLRGEPVPRTAGALEANEIKGGLQKAGADATMMDRAATKQTQETGGHEMRMALEELAPKIAPLNARETKLIDAAGAINRAVQREANQYVAHGTKAMVGALVGSEEYQRTKDPYMAAAKGLATTIALQPAVATRVAIVATRLGKLSGDAPANVARVALAAVLSGDDAKSPE